MFKLDLGKYRTLAIAIGLFLLFDLGVLITNNYTAREIRNDALNVNVIGRQRTLTQQMAKASLQLRDRLAAGQPYRELLLELERSAGLFDQSLRAYLEGGMVDASGGTQVRVAAVQDATARAMLSDIMEQWLPYRDAIQSFAAAQTHSLEAAENLARNSGVVNVWLLSLSNELTMRMEELAAARATTLRRVQLTGMLLATLNFCFIFFYFLRYLRRNDRALEAARKETEDILRTTREGLFLLDSEFRVGSQTSKMLGRIIGREDLAGQNFLDILKPMVTPKTFETTREYIELLMRHDVREKLVTSLNPLDCVEVSSQLPDGSPDVRYLQFHFNRVLSGDQVTHLLVTASDITRRVRLERELAESERKVQDQMGMMVRILQANPAQLQEFLKLAAEGLDHINEIMRASNESPAGLGSRELEQIFRLSHRLKGDAAALSLESVTKSLNGFEDLLATLRGRSNLRGEELLPLTVRIKALYAEINAIQAAMARIAQIRGVVTVEPPKPQPDPLLVGLPFVRQWNALAEQIATRQGKQVELNYQGMEIDSLPPVMRESLISIVNQFIRNAVVHGIEAPEARKQRGKSGAGRIAVYISDGGEGGVELSFRDDGAGIDPDKIRAAAVRAGRLPADVAAAADVRRLIGMIFEPGVSTRDGADEDAGQGVGLDTVRDLVANLGGRIRIGSTAGEYCHFRVFLPRMIAPGALGMPATGSAQEAA